MVVSFKNAILLESYSGTSQKGKAFGKVKFLSEEYDVFEVFCSADSADALKIYGPKHTFEHLDFDLVPDRSGGVRLVPRF